MDFDPTAFHDGELSQDEDRFEAFQNALIDRFYRSAEWTEYGPEGEEEGYWAGHFV